LGVPSCAQLEIAPIFRIAKPPDLRLHGLARSPGRSLTRAALNGTATVRERPVAKKRHPMVTVQVSRGAAELQYSPDHPPKENSNAGIDRRLTIVNNCIAANIPKDRNHEMYLINLGTHAMLLEAGSRH